MNICPCVGCTVQIAYQKITTFHFQSKDVQSPVQLLSATRNIPAALLVFTYFFFLQNFFHHQQVRECTRAEISPLSSQDVQQTLCLELQIKLSFPQLSTHCHKLSFLNRPLACVLICVSHVVSFTSPRLALSLALTILRNILIFYQTKRLERTRTQDYTFLTSCFYLSHTSISTQPLI